MNGESRRQNKTAGHHMRLLPQAKHQKYPNHEVNVAGPIDLFQRFKKKKDKKTDCQFEMSSFWSNAIMKFDLHLKMQNDL